MPDTVDPMITDAVAPGSGSPYPMALQNAVAQQQSLATLLQAATAQGAAMLFSLDGGAPGMDATNASPTTGDVRGATDQAKEQLATIHASGDAAHAKTQAHAPSPASAPGELLLQLLDRMNAVNLRQSIRIVELAAVTVILSRAAQVSTSDSNAQEQMAMWTGLLETVIRDLGAWAESV